MGPHSEEGLSGDTLVPADPSTDEPTGRISSQVHVQRHHITSFKLAMVGVCTPQELVNASNQGCPHQPLPETQRMVFLRKVSVGGGSKSAVEEWGEIIVITRAAGMN